MGDEPKPLPRLELRLYVKEKGEAHAVDVSDVSQKGRGDCFFVSALAAVVGVREYRDLFLRHIIRVNDNGTYTVTLYDFKGGARSRREVTLDKKDLLEIETDRLKRETILPVTDEKEAELWPLLLEKAYLKEFPSMDGEGAGRDPSTVMERLTGLPSQVFTLGSKRRLEHPDAPMPKLTLEALDAYRKNGYAITLATHYAVRDPSTGEVIEIPDIKGDTKATAAYDEKNPLYKEGRLSEPLVPNHSYFITNVDAKNGTVTVQNPWQEHHKDIVIPFEDLKTVFAQAQVNPVKSTGTFTGGMGAYPKKE